MAVEAQDSDQDSAEKYAYYFESERPAFVTRLIARKQRAQLERMSKGTVPGSVLEIGPGEGWFARACRDGGVPSYVAVEASPVGAENLRRAGFDIRLGKVPPLPEDLPTVDLVYASHLIEHLAGADAVLSFLTGCVGVLRPGGRIALAFPDARRLGVDFWDCDYTHSWPSTPRRVSQAAHDAGLRVVATHNCVLELDGALATGAQAARHLFPYRVLSTLLPGKEDFWYRGKMLLAPEVLMVLEPSSQEPATGG